MNFVEVLAKILKSHEKYAIIAKRAGTQKSLLGLRVGDAGPEAVIIFGPSSHPFVVAPWISYF